MKNNIIKNLSKSIVLILLFAMISPNITVQAKQAEKNDNASKVIVIDPSGQEKANNKKEPIGPGAFKTVPEVSEETDYDSSLQIAQKVGVILAEQGYTVILTRNKNNVDISNSSRAMIANTAGADVFVVISTEDKNGLNVICQSEDNPYNYGNYKNGRLLSDAILGSVTQNAKIEKSKVVESDDEAVINWCGVPTAKIEIADEDADDDNDTVLAKGIADGIESYFSQK